MKNLILGIFALLIASCASVGAVIDSTKSVATGLLDMTVGTASKVVSAVAEDVADTTAGTIKAAADKVDGETDQLQNEEEKK